MFDFNNPKSRIEEILAGRDVKPKSRIEAYLKMGASIFGPSMGKPQYNGQYLYSIEFSDWDYDYASAYMKDRYLPIGSCSAVRNGNFYGRTYDWFYDETATFIAKSKATNGRHASIGVCGSIPSLTKDIVNSGAASEAYKILPFMMLDGINDVGVVCNVNMLPGEDGEATTGSNPDGNDLLMPMIVRYVLDYANSAEHAVQLLSEANVISPQSESLNGQFHWMIADASSTYVVEFDGNDMVVIDSFVEDKPIMTNFPLDGFDGNTATAYYKPEDFDIDTTTLTPHAMGLERFDIIFNGYSSVNSAQGMRALLNDLKYTKAYISETNPYWYSEFTGVYGDIDLDYSSDVSDFADIVEAAQEAYANRQRDGKTWQTVHSSVYDISAKSLSVCVQESNDVHQFGLNDDVSLAGYRTAAEQDVIDAGKQDKPTLITTGTNITLADNTEYRLTDVTTLTIAYPSGNFEAWLRITTAASGTITITLPASSYIGDEPTFGNGETWELSIKDGIVVAGKAVSSE